MNGIRLGLIVLLLIPFHLVIGQIKFQPVFMDSCSTVETLDFWYLSDGENLYKPSLIKGNYVELTQPGNYLLFWGLIDIPYEVIIPSDVVVIDTFYASKLKFNQYVGYSDYTYCDILANGYLTGYYPNGQIKIRGTFEDGQPSKRVIHYYPNGQVLKDISPNKKGMRYKRYFENGELESDFNAKKKSSKEYYKSGQIKSKANYTRLFGFKSETFYSNGQLEDVLTKRKYLRYDDRGNLVEEIERAFLSEGQPLIPEDPDEVRHKFHKYNWKNFDEKGNLTRHIEFSESNFITKSYPIKVEDISNHLFEKIVFYDKGQPTFKIIYEYPSGNSGRVKNFTLYSFADGMWFEESRFPSDKIYELIALYS